MASQRRGTAPLPLLVSLIALSPVSRSGAATLVVPDQFPTIGAAIMASNQGDSVLVRSGIYLEHLVVPHDLSVVGLETGVIVDGGRDPDSSVVRILAPARVHLAHLTVRYGAAPWGAGVQAQAGTELWLEEVEVRANGGSCIEGRAGAGGVVADRLHAAGCTFVGNVGGWLGVGALAFAEGEVRDCVFIHNSAGGHPICAGGPGGVVTGYGDCLFERCRFESNWGDGPQSLATNGRVMLRDCEFASHGIYDGSSAVIELTGPSTLERCRFVGTQNFWGVPIVSSSDSVAITASTFEDNAGYGGTLVAVLGEIRLSDCLFARNANHRALESSGSASIDGCTFVDLTGNAAGVHANWGSVSVQRTIFAGIEMGAAIDCEPGVASDIDCNNLWENDLDYEGCAPGPHDLAADPLFCSRAGGDYTLRTDSPCLPPQSPPECGLIGAFGLGCSAESVEPASGVVAAVPLHLAINPHPAAGPTAEVLFELAQAAPVTLTLYNCDGRAVCALAAGNHESGRHRIEWDARGIAAGVYFLRLEAGASAASRKVVILDR